jgi:putative membrane protein
MWTFAPFIVIATLAVLWIDARGAARAGAWQRTGFLAGTAFVFLALQSPLDALAETSFAMHQVQHLALLSLGPMLLALSAPAETLLAGMPGRLRRWVYRPVASNRGVRATFGLLSRPPIAALVFVSVALLWLLPAAQAAALRDPWIHDTMHFSMLLAGMFLFFCAFDPRPPPTGADYGARVFALLAALLVNIPLGAYLSYKTTVLYPFYPGPERLGRPPLLDEQLGGLVQYVPGSMMLVLAVLLALRAWHAQERRQEAWRRRGVAARAEAPQPAGVRARRNLRLALTLVAVCAFMFAAAIVGGVLALR